MSIASFPPVSTAAPTPSVTFKYPLADADTLKIYPFSNEWTGVKITFFPEFGTYNHEEGARVGFLDGNKQEIGTTFLRYNTKTENPYYAFSANVIFPQDPVAEYKPMYGAVALSGTSAYVGLYSKFPGTFVIEESPANTASATSAGTLTTLTESDAAYVLAADSYVTVLGGGGGGYPANTYQQGRPGGGSGYIATAFAPAGTYSVTIGAGGSGVLGVGPTIGGTTTFTDGSSVTIEALGGGQESDGTFNPTYGGSGGSSTGSRLFTVAGVGGAPGNPSLVNGSGVIPPFYVPFQVRQGRNTEAGGVYGGGNGGATQANGQGQSGANNTGAGGGGAQSNGNSAYNGGNGGSGAVFIWTPAA